MGTDFSIACVNSHEFIALHKWYIIKDIGSCLADGFGLVHAAYKKYQFKIMTDICTSPVVRVSVDDILGAVNNWSSQQKVDYAHYIDQLIPAVRELVSNYSGYQFIITCDMGPEPWSMSEPNWFVWKEIKAAFNFKSPFLPRNLADDFQFSTWQEVLDYYEDHETWMLHNQCRDELDQIRIHFEQLIKSRSNQ